MSLFSYFLQNYILKFNIANLKDTKFGKNIKLLLIVRKDCIHIKDIQVLKDTDQI